MPESAQIEYASPRRRLTAAQRRASILAAARTEFARSGYHGASTASISRSAGCSEPMLYKHFSCKQALFTAVLEQVNGIIESGFDSALTKPGNLVVNLHESLPGIIGDPSYVEALQLRKLAVTIVDEPEVRAILKRLQARHERRVRDAVERGKAEGTIRPDVNAHDVAWTWTGLMMAGCYREALESGGFAAMLPTVEAFIDGLRS